MSLKNLRLPSNETLVSAVAAEATTAVLLPSLVREYVPQELLIYVLLKLHSLCISLPSQLTLIVDEFEGLNRNHLFQAAEIYLRPTISPNTKHFIVTMPEKETKTSISMERNEEIVDLYNGVQLMWKLVTKQIDSKWIASPGDDPYHSTIKSELRFFKLSFNKKHKDMVLETYFPYILEKSKEVREERKKLKLFTLRYEPIRGG